MSKETISKSMLMTLVLTALRADIIDSFNMVEVVFNINMRFYVNIYRYASNPLLNSQRTDLKYYV